MTLTKKSRSKRAKVIESIYWRRLDVPGHDFAQLFGDADGFSISGHCTFLESRRPCSLRYAVFLDKESRTRSALIEGWIGSRPIRAEIIVSQDGEWRLNGKKQPKVRGCLDIDLSFTPATNLLPIRRTRLKLRQSREIVAAWLEFPQLKLKPLQQVYTRREKSLYHYASSHGNFAALLSTRRSGFVSHYPKLWKEEKT